MSSVKDIEYWESPEAKKLVEIAETIEQEKFVSQKEHARWRQGMYRVAQLIGMVDMPQQNLTPEAIVSRLEVISLVLGIKPHNG